MKDTANRVKRVYREGLQEVMQYYGNASDAPKFDTQTEEKTLRNSQGLSVITRRGAR